MSSANPPTGESGEYPGDVIPFVASTVEDAVNQVRARLGPSAVVVHVRRIPVERKGWFRRSPRQRFEILAYRPRVGGLLDTASVEPAGPVSPDAPDAGAPASPVRRSPAPAGGGAGAAAPDPALHPAPLSHGGLWRVGGVLEASGFLPAHAQRVADQLRRLHGEKPPESLATELSLARDVLSGLWRSLPPERDGRADAHVLVGGAGSGKTTALCKWATQAVLAESRKARVWRLDGQTANAAESLSVHCEILGIPLERRWRTGSRFSPGETHWVDLPGVDWRNPAALRALARQIENLGAPRVHLVLNGAYDVALLLQQVRAFSLLPVDDLIVTHLDEERRWGKLWNLVLGTEHGIRFLSAGQNIPGEFPAATPETLFARQFPS